VEAPNRDHADSFGRFLAFLYASSIELLAGRWTGFFDLGGPTEPAGFRPRNHDIAVSDSAPKGCRRWRCDPVRVAVRDGWHNHFERYRRQTENLSSAARDC